MRWARWLLVVLMLAGDTGWVGTADAQGGVGQVGVGPRPKVSSIAPVGVSPQGPRPVQP